MAYYPTMVYDPEQEAFSIQFDHFWGSRMVCAFSI